MKNSNEETEKRVRALQMMIDSVHAYAVEHDLLVVLIAASVLEVATNSDEMRIQHTTSSNMADPTVLLQAALNAHLAKKADEKFTILPSSEHWRRSS